MDSRDTVRGIIESTLADYGKIPYAYGEISCEPVFDRENDHYLLVTVGWNGDRRIHGALVHIDLIDDKIWIQRDGTEHGIANELVAAGIPKDRIVLGFKPANIRPYTEFAVA